MELSDSAHSVNHQSVSLKNNIDDIINITKSILSKINKLERVNTPKK